jgi:hypothetical protein
MKGKHTWYQLAITIFSFGQMIFQLVHFGNAKYNQPLGTVQNALTEFTHIVDHCKTFGSASDFKKVSDAGDDAVKLVKEEKILTIMAIVYFVFLFIFLVLFEFIKIDERCNQNVPENVKKNQVIIRYT